MYLRNLWELKMWGTNKNKKTHFINVVVWYELCGPYLDVLSPLLSSTLA